MTLLNLFIEFLKTGLFAVGGGLATIPFLYDIADKYPWFTRTDVADMIAISESTPGPIGINMATFAGYTAAGVPGSIVSTFAIMFPGIIIVLLVARILTKFKESPLVTSAFYGIRPAVAGLITAALFEVLKVSVLNWSAFTAAMNNFTLLINYKALMLFAIVLFLVRKFKKHPILYIAGSALVGIILKF